MFNRITFRFFSPRALMCCAFFVALLFALGGGALAAGLAATPLPAPVPMQSASPKIRVGFPNFEYFSQVNPDGTYSGVVHEYLTEIAKYAGWEYEYVVDGPGEVIEMLKNKQVDLLGGILKDETTEGVFDFAASHSGFTYSVLATKRDNASLLQNDYTSIDGARVGAYKKGKRLIDQFEQFCAANGIKPQMVYLDDTEPSDALYDGRVDAILTNDLNMKPELRAVVKFSPKPFYFVTYKGNTEVMRGVNLGISKILEVNPRFDAELYTRYFEKDIPYNFALTKDEEEFVANSPPIVVVAAQDPPFSDWRGGGFSGICARVLALISERTGLKFEYIPSDGMQSALAMLDEGKAQLIAGYKIMNTNQNPKVVATVPYLSLHRVAIEREGGINLSKKRVVAIPQGSSLPPIYDDCEVVYYKTASECVDAVISGGADFALVSSYVAESTVRGRGSNVRISFTPMTNEFPGLTIGIAKPAPPLLVSVLEKAINSITTEEVQTFALQEAASQSAQISIAALIRAYPTMSVGIVLVLAAVAVGVLFMVMRMRLKFLQKAAIEDERYKILGEIADEYLLDYDFEIQRLSFSGKLARLLGKSVVERDDALECDGGLVEAFSRSADEPNRISELEYPLEDGSNEWFKCITTVIFDAQGSPLYGMGKLMSVQREREEAMALKQKVHTDALTGVHNRQYLQDRLGGQFRKGNEPCALFVVDIDLFKNVNDTMGHQAGDDVLRLLAKTLKERFPPPHMVARWGGDEFVVLYCRDDGRERIEEAAKALCAAMNIDYTYEGKTIKLSLSVGVALSDEPTPNAEKMFKHADEALYQVKQNHRNGYRVYGNPTIFL